MDNNQKVELLYMIKSRVAKVLLDFCRSKSCGQCELKYVCHKIVETINSLLNELE